MSRPRPVTLVSAVVVLVAALNFPLASRTVLAPPPPPSDTTPEDGDPAFPAPPSGPDWDRAARFHDEGSYARALEIYVALDSSTVGAEHRRWLGFLIADCTWRALSATPQGEDTELVAARTALEVLAAAPDLDRVRVEARESLGDLHWMRRGGEQWNLAWPLYRSALDDWARSRSIELSRERYLRIVRKASRRGVVPGWWRSGWQPELPRDVVESAARIARDPDDVALTRYLLARSLSGSVDTPARYERAERAFLDAEESASGHEWEDDVLWSLAQLRLRPGRPVLGSDGEMTRQPDYDGAIRALRQLLDRFREGESRYVRQARSTLSEIVDPRLDLHVGQAFLPDSRIELTLGWRNVDRIELAVYPVDLARDLDPSGAADLRRVAESIDLGDRRPVRSWAVERSGAPRHAPHSSVERLDPPFGPGAYVVEAVSGALRARALVPVTRTAAVMLTDETGALVHVADALDGTPRRDAEVALWRGRDERGSWTWSVRRARTDDDGLARFDPSEEAGSARLVAVVSWNDQPAIAWSHGHRARVGELTWTIHAFPDRPAYRPGETVRFKVVARTRDRSGALHTPSGRSVSFRVTDPRNAEITAGRLSFNDYGGAWGELELPPDVALGDCRVTFEDESTHRRTVGSAVLFAVEEYRLPEFRVDVRTPQDAEGRPRSFRPGETIEVDVFASYYFGGPVGGATAEVVVWRAPRDIRPTPFGPYPWIEPAPATRPVPYAPRAELLRTRLTLDAEGRNRLEIPTHSIDDVDWTYTIEARVTDAARREVVGTGSVHVTRQPYDVLLEPDHRVLRPSDDARIRIRAVDAEDRAIAAEGTVRVTREVWDEVWIDPFGREVSGATLATAKRRHDAFPPPPPDPSGPGWHLAFRGSRSELVVEATVRTGEDGTTEWRFSPEREGSYRITWSSEPDALWPVRAETLVWVTSSPTANLGLRPGSLEIIVDRDAFRVGETAAILLVAPVADARVLFTFEPGGVAATRLVRMRGDVALVEFPLDAGHAPSLWLHAAAVHDASLLVDRRSVPVAAADRAFDVTVELDGDVHAPGSEGRAVLRAVDTAGLPVDAEIGFAVFDEAVEAIRPDAGGDPRTVFLSGSRRSTLATTASFGWRPYVRLAPVTDATTDPRAAERERRDDDGLRKSDAAIVGGITSEPARAAEAAEFVSDLAVTEAGKRRQAVAAGEVHVRTDFRATAVWEPGVLTGPDGVAEVRFRWPESLTAWKATARGAGRDARFGFGTSSARTSKPLTVRLQAPRFLVSGDRAIVSAIVNNNGDDALVVSTSLDALGVATDGPADVTRSATLERGGEARFDWPVSASAAGEAELAVRVVADGPDGVSDGMMRRIPIVEHGIEKLVARSGKVRGGETTVLFDLPADRRPGSTTVSIRISPSLAITALDALPYLIEYPYGCTEQTLSRFVPAVIVRRTLTDLGLDPADIEGRMFGGIEPEHVTDVQGDREQALGRLDEVVEAGVTRLFEMQRPDGSWGWWTKGASDPFLTAYAAWGLSEAARAGAQIDRSSLRRAVDWLDRRLVDAETDPDLHVWMLHAVASAGAGSNEPLDDRRVRAFERAYERRDSLGAYGKALLALAAHRFGRLAEAEVVVRNLENGVIRDDRPNRSELAPDGPRGGGIVPTAHWGAEGLGWRWSDGPVETTAFVLRALLAVRPDHPLIEPATEWLVRNRRGAQWRHTRETAIAVLALTDYLQVSGELHADATFRVEVNGSAVGEASLTPDTVLLASPRFELDPTIVRNGENRVRIVRTSGTGPLYFAVEAEYFSLEEPITPSGNHIFVAREYLVRQPYDTLLAGTRFDLVPVADDASVNSGDRLDVVLTVEAKNDLEYLVFEDLKPAGFEAVELRSGGDVVARRLRRGAVSKAVSDRTTADYTGEARRVHRELRDRKIASFVDRLPEGLWEIRYELRAETPGRFHGLPVVTHAMYAPEIRANGAEHRVEVRDDESGVR